MPAWRLPFFNLQFEIFNFQFSILRPMKWFLGAILLLAAALVLQSGLLAYAMYVLLAVMVISRGLARNWLANVRATRTRDRLTAESGALLAAGITMHNSRWLALPSALLGDMLPLQ